MKDFVPEDSTRSGGGLPVGTAQKFYETIYAPEVATRSEELRKAARLELSLAMPGLFVPQWNENVETSSHAFESGRRNRVPYGLAEHAKRISNGIICCDTMSIGPAHV